MTGWRLRECRGGLSPTRYEACELPEDRPESSARMHRQRRPRVTQATAPRCQPGKLASAPRPGSERAKPSRLRTLRQGRPPSRSLLPRTAHLPRSPRSRETGHRRPRRARASSAGRAEGRQPPARGVGARGAAARGDSVRPGGGVGGAHGLAARGEATEGRGPVGAHSPARQAAVPPRDRADRGDTGSPAPPPLRPAPLPAPSADARAGERAARGARTRRRRRSDP
ncbi:signal transducer CD24 isoform X2 [Cavia porcellus]|uniref:signal transducer CD24 isoform X2 n=1 Tax=Cavia porcellus TaxID=10141 RepID=UPI002FE2044B